MYNHPPTKTQLLAVVDVFVSFTLMAEGVVKVVIAMLTDIVGGLTVAERVRQLFIYYW